MTMTSNDNYIITQTYFTTGLTHLTHSAAGQDNKGMTRKKKEKALTSHI